MHVEFSHFFKKFPHEFHTLAPKLTQIHRIPEYIFFTSNHNGCCVTALEYHLNTKTGTSKHAHGIFAVTKNSDIPMEISWEIEKYHYIRSEQIYWQKITVALTIFRLVPLAKQKNSSPINFNTRPFATTDYRKGRKYGGIRSVCEDTRFSITSSFDADVATSAVAPIGSDRFEMSSCVLYEGEMSHHSLDL